MQKLSGKTAFVTGGASGIGLALGRAFLDAGMKVMLADIEAGSLRNALKDLKKFGSKVSGVKCDVTDASSMKRAAAKTFKTFGKVHVLCNNAGVAASGGIDNIDLNSWRWVIDVNLMGVVHGIRAFLPHMRAHKEGGHIVNTASMAGMQSGMGFHPYTATKFAVVAMSEGLVQQVAPDNIGVTVLCPAYVRTRIGEAQRNRQKRYGAAPPPPDPSSELGKWLAELNQRLQSGREPSDIAAQVLRAIHENELYCLTHPEDLGELETRLADIKTAMEKAKAR